MVFQASEEECGETRSFSLQSCQAVIGDQLGEEGLCQVGSVFWLPAVRSDKGIDRLPIEATEPLHGDGAAWPVRPRSQHHRPLRGGEPRGLPVEGIGNCLVGAGAAFHGNAFTLPEF